MDKHDALEKTERCAVGGDGRLSAPGAVAPGKSARSGEHDAPIVHALMPRSLRTTATHRAFYAL